MRQDRDLWPLVLVVLALAYIGVGLFPGPGQAIGGHDVRGLFVPWWQTFRESVYAGRFPLWDPTTFAGYPFFANPQVGLFYPPAWLTLVLIPPAAVSWYAALHIAIAGLGMRAYLLAMGASRTAAGVGALAFAFSGFTAARLYAGHIGLLATLAWTPWIGWALLHALRRDGARTAVLAAVPVGLAVLAGHTTSLIYVALIVSGLALYLVLAGEFPLRRVLLTGGVMAAVGLGLGMVQLMPLVEFIGQSARAATADYAFATQQSLPPAHLITLIVPEFFGEPLRAGYWSVPNFEELTLYAGVLPVIGLAAAIAKPDRRVAFYLALVGVGLLLAFGSYSFFYQTAYNLLPPLRLMRSPGRASFLWVFAACALLAEAITRWEDEPDTTRLDAVMRAVLIIGGVAGLAALAATGAVFAAQHPTDTSGRLWHQVGGWGLFIVWALASGGLLWAYLRAEKRRRLLLVALCAVLLADLWTFGGKFTRLEPLGPSALWVDTAALAEGGSRHGRVLPWGLSIFTQNGAMQVGVPSIFGYNALEVAHVQQLAASVPDPRAASYDVLGASVVIAGLPLEEGFLEGEQGLELAAQMGAVWVYERPGALPIARMVPQAEVISAQAAAIERVHASGFNPAATAILDREAPCVNVSDAGTATIVDHDPARWQLAVDSPEGGLLVLAETDYPGWRAYVDGVRVETYRAYAAVRAVCVPPGEHTVEWRFLPVSLVVGGVITALTIAGVVGVRTTRPNSRHGALRRRSTG